MTGRATLEVFGKKGKRDYVRVVRERAGGQAVIRVLWKDGTGRRLETFEDSRNGLREAKAFADSKHDALKAPTVTTYADVSLRGLFERYLTAKQDAWRGRTLVLERERWRKFELYADRQTVARIITRESLDGFKRTMLERGHAHNQVARHVECVKRVFRWGVDRDLIPPTKVTTYRAEFSKDAKLAAPVMAEFKGEERDRMIAVLDPRKALEWRAWTLMTLIGFCGPRQNAARHLTWADVDLVRGEVVWRPEHDKMGNGRIQPLPKPVHDALWVAYGWRLADGYEGRFVFYGAQDRTRRQDKPWTYQAFVAALHNAEARAGIPSVKWKGAHAFRRGIAGDVLSRTGSEKRAAEWIGDKDLDVVKRSYLLERPEELAKTASLLQPDATEPYDGLEDAD